MKLINTNIEELKARRKTLTTMIRQACYEYDRDCKKCTFDGKCQSELDRIDAAIKYFKKN